MQQEKQLPTDLLAWAEGTHCAITVCDLQGQVIFMNEQSRATFDREGRTMLGQNLMPCHSTASQQKIRHMLATDTTNCYTIDKQRSEKDDLSDPMAMPRASMWHGRNFDGDTRRYATLRALANLSCSTSY